MSIIHPFPTIEPTPFTPFEDDDETEDDE